MNGMHICLFNQLTMFIKDTLVTLVTRRIDLEKDK